MSGRPSEFEYVETPLLNQLEKFGWKTIRLDKASENDPATSMRESLAEVIIEKELKAAIKRLNTWLTDAQINDLCTKMQTYPFQSTKLLENNIKMFDNLGMSADCEETGETSRPVQIIDWEDVDGFNKNNSKNSFLAISQFKVRLAGKEEHIIPDIVLFVNGLPFVVIECKAPDIADPIAEGIEQLLRYQDRRGAKISEGVPELFYYNQLVIVTDYHSARYSSITGNASHFIEWKDPYPLKLSDINANGTPASQELLVAGMLEPSRLLDIVQNYIVFIEDNKGRTKKIVPRYMQYRGAYKIIERLRKDKTGGTLWHTQGSGKSLTMMFVIRKMFNSKDLHDYKIVLLIDRKDLQSQLYKTSSAIRYTVTPADSIEHLKTLLKNTSSDISIAMVHKFTENTNETFPILNESNKILVMIDEAHRSEYSNLAANMWRSMPNAVKIAFTGTPITKTLETFGGYIDQYTMRQAVEDEVVVEIKYEGRATDSKITDKNAMNRDFEDVFKLVETEEQIKIMGKYTAKGYLEATEIIAKKAEDMIDHYINAVFPNGFKAQVVGVSKEAAVRYKKAIDEILPKKISELKQSNPNCVDIQKLECLKTACIISTALNDEPHLKTFANDNENEIIIDGFKAPFGEKGEKGGDGNYGIIVVTAMLLTGFDAPIEQVMYLDKVLRNHTLLQAITRVNRTYGADKKCGYIVDYVGVTNHLREALSEYADPDIEATMAALKDSSQDIDSLNNAYNNILQFISDSSLSIDNPQNLIEELVADDKLRDKFNSFFVIFMKLFDRVLPNPAALNYSDTFKSLSFIRESIAKRCRNSYFSMKDASKKIRAIIENYLDVKGVNVEIEPISLLSENFLIGMNNDSKSDRATCDEIKYAIREYINVNISKDPEFYTRLSEKLEELLKIFKDNWLELKVALTKLREDVVEGRKREKTYGYEPEHEMPFFALIKKELFGDKDFSELPEESFNALKDITNDVLERLKCDTKIVNFWENIGSVNTLRTYIINQLIAHIPSIFDKRKEIAQKILDLGCNHF